MKVISASRKEDGQPKGYCFIEFATEDEAERVLKLVNATDIPGSKPAKRFRLNRSQAGKNWDIGPSYSVFVGDLDPGVTDDKLEDFFAKRYRSVKGAKIMYEEGGISRGYGFVRFSDETEKKRAMLEMQGAKGLGNKSIRVSEATPKGKLQNDNSSSGDTNGATNYNQQWYQQYAENYQYYQQYMAYYNQYPQQYQQQYYQQQQAQLSQAAAQYSAAVAATTATPETSNATTATRNAIQPLPDKLEDPDPPIDVDVENELYFAEQTVLLDHVLGNHWQPLDSMTSKFSDEVH